MKVVAKAICLFLIAVVAISAAPARGEAASAAEIHADVDATLHIVLVDSTNFTTLFGGTDSLENFWRNLALMK